MRIGNDKLIDNSQAMSSNFELAPIWLGHIENYSIQLFFTGTPNGVFKLQASNDLGNPVKGEAYAANGVENWTDILNSEQAITEAGDHMWQVCNAGYRWVRVVYTNSGGTGSLDLARFNVKGY